MLPAKRLSCVLGTILMACQVVPTLVAAQDETMAERAFRLLGLEDGIAPTEDPGRIAEGLPLLREAAAAGEPLSQNALGMAYANGFFGLEVNIDRALALYKQAMDSEVAGTIASLNWALTNYAIGNEEVAIEILDEIYATDPTLAPPIAATLAEAYAFGNGVAADYSRAGALYEAAVEWNPDDRQSHYMLGRGYESGFFDGGIQPDRALSHYRSAAELGDPRAAWKIGMAHLQGHPDFAGGSAAAYSWVRRSAEGGWVDGMISTAVMLATGEGTDRDAEEAAYWYREAAILGSAHAMRGLGAMHYNGELDMSDRTLGLALLELGAEGGDEIALSILDSIQSQIQDLERSEVDRAKADWTQRINSTQ
jgi:TPR repeat protein